MVDKIDCIYKELTSISANLFTGAKLLGFFVQDLLDLAQIRAGVIKKNMCIANINQILDEIVKIQHITASLRKINLSFRKIYDSKGKDLLVYTDALRIQQITLNFLTNALKFTNRGGKVEVGAAII